MELLILTRIALENPDKKIFVDTNIAIETLREIADPTHVALMLAPGEMSVSRFFDRPDAEKQFIYQKLLECPDPDAALANYRKILEKCNSPEIYRAFEASGFLTSATKNSKITAELIKMKMEDVIKRINELARKAKTETLSEEELAERDELRQIYIKSVRENLRAQLDNTYIVTPDGEKRKLKN